MGLFNQDLGKYVYIVPQKTYLSGEEATEVPQAVKSKDDIVILTATENFSKTESGSATNFRVGDGTDRSDNYKVNGARITFTGVIGPRLVNMLSTFLGGTPQTALKTMYGGLRRFSTINNNETLLLLSTYLMGRVRLTVFLLVSG